MRKSWFPFWKHDLDNMWVCFIQVNGSIGSVQYKKRQTHTHTHITLKRIESNSQRNLETKEHWSDGHVCFFSFHVARWIWIQINSELYWFTYIENQIKHWEIVKIYWMLCWTSWLLCCCYLSFVHSIFTASLSFDGAH